ncbi:cation-translocating P-type ATPase [Halofilum ochraceum]|uniref:cation-translocating P-type ATPase n=1 Tax=Halofilum ochraceum TaxID=1611323 RepID=UPI0008D9225C|nr:HAD-IC family P-type ATPase [Halofilum ochraceum]
MSGTGTDNVEKPPVHALDTARALRDLDARGNGLSADEAAQRRERYGENRLPEPASRGPLSRFAAQFNDTLVYVLLVAGAVTALLEKWVDTGAILGIVVINAIIGVFQEGRAEHALAAIRNMLTPTATVRRDGRRTTIDAASLVPGDIVILGPGDKVPADLRLTRVRELRIDESPLTGESEPVDKITDPVAPDAALGDRRNLAFSGSLVSSGDGEGVVCATGSRTELGAMTTMLAGVEHVATPLTRQMRRFGKRLTVAIIGIAAAVFLMATVVRAWPWTDAFLAAVGLAVAAIPQGLPAIMTITLAVGIQAMARRNAVVRRMHAAETLGSVNTICSDKTGTLTRNEMTAVTLAPDGDTLNVTGTGYAPEGEFRSGEKTVAPLDDERLTDLLRACLLCNDASIEADTTGQWQLQGDPTEGALITVARKAGLDPDAEAARQPRIDAVPFASEHRYMATLHGGENDRTRVYVKGAPEQILGMCDRRVTARGVERLDREVWHERAEAIAAEGQRVLALARTTLPADQEHLDHDDVAGDLELLGLVGLIDPPREDALTAVAECQQAGIRVKMITGDHATTAAAVAKRMGIHNDDVAVLTGNDLDAMDDQRLATEVVRVDVFARVSPQHKLRLVKALQAQGQVVAMTGDGVNDAAALKRADVGVAMGRKGTEVAREAADIVLTDDNFTSIAAAVRYGRTAYDNIKRSVLFLLPTNGGEALAIIAAVIAGMQLPVTPVQILWVNMVTAATLGLSLAFEPAAREVMRRPPRPPGESMIEAALVGRIALVALTMLVGTFGLYGLLRHAGVELEVARTAAVNTLVLFEAFYLFNARLLNRPLRHWRDLGGNVAVWYSVGIVVLLQLAFTYIPPMQLLFGSAALPPLYWLVLIPLTFLVVPIVELEKYFIEKRRRRPGTGLPAGA